MTTRARRRLEPADNPVYNHDRGQLLRFHCERHRKTEEQAG
ncbi:MAG TPA: hypothetical protein VLU73_04085 [Methylococcaceae bacterium]|jgi:hypothetical protein|nr:hypothetical protein [Methylococcaceae bacterium]